MAQTRHQLISKGLFAIAAVAVAGVVGSVSFATAAQNNAAAGYGDNGQQAIAAANKFQSELKAEADVFNQRIIQLSDQAKAELEADGDQQVDQFDKNYLDATSMLSQDTDAAFNTFRSQVQNNASMGPNKDQFIDSFNHAKADYFNNLDAAKNKFAERVSNMGNNANVAKDHFIGGFNSARDTYGNQMEQSKNDFAAVVSNL